MALNIPILFFFQLKISRSISAIAFYWRNDTQPLLPDPVCPKISSSLSLIILLAVFPYIGSLDKCHTSAFNALKGHLLETFSNSRTCDLQVTRATTVIN